MPAEEHAAARVPCTLCRGSPPTTTARARRRTRWHGLRPRGAEGTRTPPPRGRLPRRVTGSSRDHDRQRNLRKRVGRTRISLGFGPSRPPGSPPLPSARLGWNSPAAQHPRAPGGTQGTCLPCPANDVTMEGQARNDAQQMIRSSPQQLKCSK